MKKLLELVMLLVTTATLVVLGPATALAAPDPSTINGYRLSPVRTNLTVNPSANATVTVYIQNATNSVENLQVIINDFVAPTNESGNPALLLNGASAPDHSLKKFVSVPTPTLTLQPGEQKAVNVIVTIPAGAASGGYYGAVRFGPAGSDNSKNVNLSASVASLILVTVPGNLVDQLSIASFGVAQGNSTNLGNFFFSNKNLQAIVRFQNTGNIHEVPFGKVLLRKGSATLNTYSINNTDSPGNVLPGSIRLFNVKLDKISWFGKYKIEGNFGYGSKGQLLTAQSTFYIIPLFWIILLIVVILLIVALIISWPRFLKRYNNRVIARANRRR